MNLLEARQFFPAVTQVTYLNTAEGGAISTQAAHAAGEYYSASTLRADLPWYEWVEQTDSIRARVAELFCAEKSDIAFCSSVSTGMNLLAQCFDKIRDEVITLVDEFPSATLPWIHQGYKVTFVNHREDGSYDLKDIERALSPSTRILVVSHVQYNTGYRHNLRALGEFCVAHKMFLIVDATQSAGAIDLSLKDFEWGAVIFSCYKWMCAGYGAAVLAVRTNRIPSVPPFAGWWSVQEPNRMNNQQRKLRDGAGAFELGHPSFAPIFCLGGALEIISQIGFAAISNRVRELSSYLRKRLVENSFTYWGSDSGEHSGITVVHSTESELWMKALEREKIIVSVRGGGIRVSPHFYNIPEEIDLFVDTLLRVRNV